MSTQLNFRRTASSGEVSAPKQDQLSSELPQDHLPMDSISSGMLASQMFQSSSPPSGGSAKSKLALSSLRSKDEDDGASPLDSVAAPLRGLEQLLQDDPPPDDTPSKPLVDVDPDPSSLPPPPPPPSSPVRLGGPSLPPSSPQPGPPMDPSSGPSLAPPTPSLVSPTPPLVSQTPSLAPLAPSLSPPVPSSSVSPQVGPQAVVGPQPPVPQPPAPIPAKLKGAGKYTVSDDLQRQVHERIAKRGGTAVGVKVEDKYYTKQKDTGVAAANVASMAHDPGFEAAAMRAETKIGALAYNHPKSMAVATAASQKILAYLDRKHATAQDQVAAVNKDLEAFGMKNKDYSAAVGKNAAAVRAVLEKGALGERVEHVTTFVTNVLANDLMDHHTKWREHAEGAGLKMDELSEARKRVAFTGDRYLAYDLPEDSGSSRQWHSRMDVDDVKKEGKLKKLEHHPSSVTPPKADPKVAKTTTRSKDQIEQASPAGLGVKLGEQESAFQKKANGGDPKKLAWEEGARSWVLNEIDTWVYAQRQMSLPLAAGQSGTTARIMQAFSFLNVGPPDDVRLAAIGNLLPPRHHSLVEVMEGAKPYKASAYREGPMMYRDLLPLKESEVLDAIDRYPDEWVDPNNTRGGHSSGIGPTPMSPPQVNPQPPPRVEAPRPESPQRKKLNDTVAAKAADLVYKPYQFTETRNTMSAKGISNVFKNRNSAQARMLRAMDAFHAEKDETAKMRQLVQIKKEAEHWLTKHANGNANDIRKFQAVATSADYAIKDYQNRYLIDLGKDKLFADSKHAEKAVELVDDARKKPAPSAMEKLIKDNGLTEAEVAAIRVYTGPAYKFINPALDGDADRLNSRLGGFVRESGMAMEGLEGKDLEAATKRARDKLLASEDPVAQAIAEASRTAAIATTGLDKLPAYTGTVYAGGCITTKEAMARFKTGTVQQRGAFSSTTKSDTQAGIFAASKYSDLQDAWDMSEPKDPAAKPFPFMLKYQSKTGRLIEAFSAKPDEQEVLFAPQSKLKITLGADRAKPEGGMGMRTILAEEVPG